MEDEYLRKHVISGSSAIACMLNHVRSWLYVGDESRPFVVLDGLPDLYGLEYDSTTACGLPLYLCSYKLDGSVTTLGHGHYGAARPARTGGGGEKGREGVGCYGPKRREGEEMRPSGFSYFLFLSLYAYV